MGYWSQDEQGHSFAGDGSLIWGDAPADIIGEAISQVLEAFHNDVGRRPTVAELRAGFEFSLRPLEDDGNTPPKAPKPSLTVVQDERGEA